MKTEKIKESILGGRTSLGIELGSTRIKGILVDENNEVIASGGYSWENKLENGIWTYHLNDVWTGMRECYRTLAEDVRGKYDIELTSVGAMGISGMMHGYLVFDKEGRQLADFRTWRNTVTERSAAELSELFGFNIPQRWSIAHLDRAILNGEDHIKSIDFMTTLAGYVHWMLTGEKAIGIGEASGMFPINSETHDFDETMIKKFDSRVADKIFLGSCATYCRQYTAQEILPASLRKRAQSSLIRQESSNPVFRSARRRATQAPAWWQRTALLRERAMYLLEHRYLQ